MDTPLYCYFGHHKCASHYCLQIVRQVCNRLGLSNSVFRNAKHGRNIREFVAENGVQFLSYDNADAWLVRDLRNVRGFHVIRDPRDIIVSGYFSHLNSHTTESWPELAKWRQELRSMSLEEGLLREIRGHDMVFRHLYFWNYQQPNVFEIKMEQLIEDSFTIMLKAFRFLGLVESRDLNRNDGIGRLGTTEFLRIIHDHSFEKLAKGRKRGQEDPNSHYRKGISGDWANYFRAEHVAAFKDLYNDLLLQLGYEQTPDWGVPEIPPATATPAPEPARPNGLFDRFDASLA